MSKICSNCSAENKDDAKYCAVCGYQLPVNPKEEIKTAEPVKGKAKKPNLVSVIAFVVTFMVTFFATQYFLSPSVDSQLEKVAEDMNKTLPIKIDEYMTLDRVSALKNKTIQYEYSLKDLTKAEVKLDTVKKYIFPPILENIKTNPTMEVMRKGKVTFRYSYKDKNGVFVTDYVVTPEMYKSE